jgi:FixJ family two-component response regulator
MQHEPSAADLPDAIVHVVDDDPDMCEVMADLLASVGLDARTYGSAESYLAAVKPDRPSCLVLDVQLAGTSGLELQRQMLDTGALTPIVFISGHGDVAMSVRALRAGAVTFLSKPFEGDALIDAVREGLERDARARAQRREYEELEALHARLTPREREVLAGVVGGESNKQIGRDLGISEVTVKLHRAHVMRKLGCATLAELVRLEEKRRASNAAVT